MIRALLRARRVFFTGSAFLFFFLGGVLLSYAVLPLLCLRGTEVERARRCRRAIARTWVLFHDYMRWTRLLIYDARKVRLALPDGPCVVIANHPTLVDVTALVAALPDCAYVVKRAMYRNPLVGPVQRRCRHIDAGDGGAFSGVSVIEQALAHLAQGTPVLLFPEGTRSPERGLGDFRSGAFQIAVQAGVPIVPLVVTCDPPTLMRGQPWYEVPARTAVLGVRSLPAIVPDGRPAAVVAREVGRLYLRQLGLAAEELPAAPAAVAEPGAGPLAAASGS